MGRCVILPKSDGFTAEGILDLSPEGGVRVCQREDDVKSHGVFRLS